LSITISPAYDILKNLNGQNLRFRDFIALGIQKATLAKLLRELEDNQLIERKVISTRPFKTEYGITKKGKAFYEETRKSVKGQLESDIN
jgi:DNA-binding HxlR family transcriptional regulator